MKITIKTILYSLLALLIVLIVGGMLLARIKLIATEDNIFGYFSSYQNGHELSADLLRNKEVIDAQVALLKQIPLPEEKRELKGKIDKKFEESFKHISTLLESEDSISNLANLRQIKLAFTDFEGKINQFYLFLYYGQTSSGPADPRYSGPGDAEKLILSIDDASKLADASISRYNEQKKSELAGLYNTQRNEITNNGTSSTFSAPSSLRLALRSC
jgi:hypothetical protein